MSQLKTERFKFHIWVVLILRKDQKILLGLRNNTGSGDGFYACVGGGVDGNEPITHALVREAREEIGIELKPEHLKVVHVLHVKDHAGRESVGFFMEAAQWEGEPRNIEPHKCDHIAWFDPEHLPENTWPSFRHALTRVNRNEFYSEFGW